MGWYYWWPIYQVEQRVKLALNDPESARFRSINFNRSNRTGCGVVNAKNKMGGYVGDTHFIATNDGEVMFQPSDEGQIGSEEQKLKALELQVKYIEASKAMCLTPTKKDRAGKAP